MSATLKLDVDQIKTLVDQLSVEEMADLARYVQRKTTLNHLQQMQDKLKDVSITEEEIEAEVETVRRERYEKRRPK